MKVLAIDSIQPKLKKIILNNSLELCRWIYDEKLALRKNFFESGTKES